MPGIFDKSDPRWPTMPDAMLMININNSENYDISYNYITKITTLELFHVLNLVFQIPSDTMDTSLKTTVVENFKCDFELKQNSPWIKEEIGVLIVEKKVGQDEDISHGLFDVSEVNIWDVSFISIPNVSEGTTGVMDIGVKGNDDINYLFSIEKEYFCRAYTKNQSIINGIIGEVQYFYSTITENISFLLLPINILLDDVFSNVTFTSATLTGTIETNPKGALSSFGFIWWNGGRTGDDPNNLTWPGKDEGIQSVDQANNWGYFDNFEYIDNSNNFFKEDETYQMPFEFSHNVQFLDKNNDNIENSTIWVKAYAINKKMFDGDEETNTSFSENFVKIVLLTGNTVQVDLSTNFVPTYNTLKVYGSITLNKEEEIKAYGFCWCPQVRDSSTNIFIIPEISIEEQIKGINGTNFVNLYNSDNHQVGGLFPGLDISSSQIPPKIIEGGQPWVFYFTIGTSGEEIKQNGGVIEDEDLFISFDIMPNTNYTVRSWVQTTPLPDATIQDNNETQSGIFYGPLWYNIGYEAYNDIYIKIKQTGLVFITSPIPPCDISNVKVTIKYISIQFESLFITQPGNIITFGFCWKEYDGEPPTINDKYIVFTNNENFIYTLTDFLPKTKYSVKAFANNGQLSYSESTIFETLPMNNPKVE